MKKHVVPSRMKQLSPRRSATVAVLDVGSSKIACLIARLTRSGCRAGRLAHASGAHSRHRAPASRGVKNGLIVDMDEAESAIRQTVDAAERMAAFNRAGHRHRFRRPAFFAAFHRQDGDRRTRGRGIRRASRAGSFRDASDVARPHRSPLPPDQLFSGRGSRLREPKSMIGDELGVDLHVASCDQPLRAISFWRFERGHLGIEAMAALPMCRRSRCWSPTKLKWASC